MSNYVNQDTDFSNINITNDYPIIEGGSWTAKLINGKTVYVDDSGTQSDYTGHVNFIGANLTISTGAVVDNVVVIGNSIITVQTGGKLSNSSVFTGTVIVQPNGVSTNNNYVSSKVSLVTGTPSSQGAISSKDFFYNIDSTNQISGSLTTSLEDIYFQTSDGLGKLTVGNKFVSISDPVIKGSETTSTIINMGQNSTFGKYSVFTDRLNNGKAYFSNYSYTLENKYQTMSNGNWTACLGDDGVTYYTQSGYSTRYTGPLNLYDISSLTITKGAVVDNLSVFMTGSNSNVSTITISQGATLSNSLIGNSIIINYGTSSNNTYVSPQYVGGFGAVSDGDYFVQYGPSSINVKLAKNQTIKGGMIGSVKSSVTLEQNTYFASYIRNSYSGTGTVLKISNAAIIACFLAGTMINTVNGLKAIEDISVGEQVITYNGDKEEIRSVIWTGYNTVKVKQHLQEDVAGYPVRILKDAISEGVPAKDLLITSEHCIFLNDSFIPVRMLVNGSSIFYDHSITEYTYYHIETEEHSIITADGVLTESYLDTGNRSSFISDDNIISIVNKNKKWNIDSAAPLITAREVIEPIFATLIERATKLGLELPDIDIQTTNDSNLHLLANSGEKIYPTSQKNGSFIFKLPENITKVRLISLTSRPSDVVGPYVDDRRNLGVLVGKITLIEKSKTVLITDHLTSTNLYGWDVVENGSCRWTNGNASLTIRSEISNNLGILFVEVIACGPYILTQDQQKKNIA